MCKIKSLVYIFADEVHVILGWRTVERHIIS